MQPRASFFPPHPHPQSNNKMIIKQHGSILQPQLQTNNSRIIIQQQSIPPPPHPPPQLSCPPPNILPNITALLFVIQNHLKYVIVFLLCFKILSAKSSVYSIVCKSKKKVHNCLIADIQMVNYKVRIKLFKTKKTNRYRQKYFLLNI